MEKHLSKQKADFDIFAKQDLLVIAIYIRHQICLCTRYMKQLIYLAHLYYIDNPFQLSLICITVSI